MLYPCHNFCKGDLDQRVAVLGKLKQTSPGRTREIHVEPVIGYPNFVPTKRISVALVK